jgi:UDP-N-acetylmuramoylalanine--D-glutamate ligase
MTNSKNHPKYLLYGFGISLQSIAKVFKRQGTDFYIHDDKETAIDLAESLGYLTTRNISTVIKHKQDYKNNIQDLLGITDIVVTPGIYPDNPLLTQMKGVRIWNDISLFFHLYKPQNCIGITGTFGKSTTVQLLQHIYNDTQPIQIAGNIGVPIFDCNPEEPMIIELSAQQLEQCSNLQLKVAVLLNLYPQHLDRYLNLETYLNTKLKIFNNAEHKIMSHEVYESTPNLIPNINKTISFVNRNTDYFIDKNHIYENGILMLQNEIQIPAISLIGAYSVLRFLNLPVADIAKKINSFKSLPHRCEIVNTKSRHLKDIMVINDSKSTNLLNSLYCLELFKNQGSIGWIVGGYTTQQDFTPLHGLNIPHFITTTGQSGKIMNEFILSNLNINTKYCPDLVTCIKTCIEHGCKTIIFSPGYPSFDEYLNFVYRGNYFKQLIIDFV